MEKLKGPVRFILITIRYERCTQDSIAVVGSRFSDGYDVVGCVLDFYKVRCLLYMVWLGICNTVLC